MTPSQALHTLGRIPLSLRAKLHTDAKRLRAESRLVDYAPYPKQLEFHAAGATYRERLLMAGNQVGKTLAGGAEFAMHLTGLYPSWWQGRRFDKPIVSWAAGVTSEVTRDSVQRILMGRANVIGTGTIPKKHIKDSAPKRGVSDALDTVVVRHVSGGESLLTFKSYDQGRTKFQAETLDLVWLDEEPEQLDIYTEALTRTNNTNGLIFMTFTPLFGLSHVVRRFLNEKTADMHVTMMTIDDAEHYSDAQRARIIASYPIYERDARTKGIPSLGSGAVFPVNESDIRIDPISIPDHWPRINSIDFGWDHPFAWTAKAWDRDTDTVYIYDEYRRSQATPKTHVADLREKPGFEWIPVAWPHDGLQHDKGSGIQLAETYRNLGMNLLMDKFSNPPGIDQEEGQGGNGVEAGITDMLTRMETGRLKVFSTCPQWFEEFRQYHRENGKVVALGDDLMSSSRIGIMSLRFAETKPVAFRPQRHAIGARNW